MTQLSSKLTDSKWQVKVAGFEELRSRLSKADPSDQMFNEYAEKWKGWMNERHAMV